MTTQSYRLTAGSIANLALTTVELPEPKPNEVTISVRAIGLNFADVFAIWGIYSATPKGEFTPGLEYAGVVEKVGNQVKNIHIGDKVMGITRFGAYSRHLNIDARYVLPLPTNWSFETGSAYLVQTLTAYYGMTHLGNLRKGQTVLIHSAAGGVGLQALKIAKAFDCHAIGTVGHLAKADFAKTRGYDSVIVRGKDFEHQLRKTLDGRPLHLVMDSVGGQYFTIPYQLLAPTGRMVVFGSARFATRTDKPNKLKLYYEWLRRPMVDPMALPQTNRGVLGFNLIWLYEQVELMHQLLHELDEIDLSPPHVGHTYTFTDLPEAVRKFQGGETVGKVVISIG